MKELNIPKPVELREIKSTPLKPEEIDRLAEKAGSYEAIFNKRARKLREKGLKAGNLHESDFKKLLNEDYSFLKRPVLENNNRVLAGNSKSTVQEMNDSL